jgi:hypothetical protein
MARIPWQNGDRDSMEIAASNPQAAATFDHIS